MHEEIVASFAMAHLKTFVLPRCERRMVEVEAMRGLTSATMPLPRVALAWLGSRLIAAGEPVRTRGSVAVEPEA
jgi:hypothetical protein